MKLKLKRIMWPIIYLILIINVCLSFILVFRSYYFKAIFVSGNSMNPTLKGGSRADYGIIDDHKTAIDHLKRFNIVTTYYPFAKSTDYKGGYVHGGVNEIDKNNCSYKIKRVYGLPNETIRFHVEQEDIERIEVLKNKGASYEEVATEMNKAIQFSIKEAGSEEFSFPEVNFKRLFKENANYIDLNKYKEFEYELGEDEYWVMGDNYCASFDCFSQDNRAPIYRDNIVGVLVAIEGTCKIFEKYSNKGKTDQDGTSEHYFECKERKRHLPVYYI